MITNFKSLPLLLGAFGENFRIARENTAKFLEALVVSTAETEFPMSQTALDEIDSALSSLDPTRMISLGDGDVITVLQFSNAMKAYSGDMDVVALTLGGSDWTYSELSDSMSASFQTSSIMSFVLTKTASNSFDIASLTSYVNSSFGRMTGPAQALISSISQNFIPSNRLGSVLNVIKGYAHGMDGGDYSTGTINFDQDDFSVSTVWAAMSLVGVATVIEGVFDVIVSLVDIFVRGLGSLLKGVTSLFRTMFSVEDGVINTDADLDISNIPVFRKTVLIVVSSSTIDVIEAIRANGSVCFQNALAYFRATLISDETSYVWLLLEAYPSTTGRIHNLCFRVDSGFVSGNSAINYNTYTSFPDIPVSMRSGIEIQIDVHKTYDPLWVMSGHIVPSASSSVFDDLEVGSYTIGDLFLVGVGDPITSSDYSHVHALLLQNTFLSVLMAVWDDETSPYYTSVILVRTNPSSYTVYQYNFPETTGFTSADVTIGTEEEYYSTLTKLIITHFWGDAGDCTWADAIDSAVSMVEPRATIWPDLRTFSQFGYDRINSEVTVASAGFIQHAFKYGYLAQTYSNLTPRVLFATTEDYVKVARNILVAALVATAAVIVVAASFAIRSWVRRKSVARQAKYDAAKAAYGVSPTKANMDILQSAAKSNSRWFKMTGYLDGANWGGGGETNVDLSPVIELIR